MNRVFAVLIGAVALLAAGCASTGGKGGGKSSAAAPEIRAQERWNHLIAKEADQAYDYLTPGTRSTKTREVYAKDMNERPVKWLSVEVQGKVCAKETSCKVSVLVTYSAKLPLIAGGEVTSPAVLEEQWIAVDDVWYYVPADFVQASGLR